MGEAFRLQAIIVMRHGLLQVGKNELTEDSAAKIENRAKQIREVLPSIPNIQIRSSRIARALSTSTHLASKLEQVSPIEDKWLSNDTTPERNWRFLETDFLSIFDSSQKKDDALILVGHHWIKEYLNNIGRILHRQGRRTGLPNIDYSFNHTEALLYRFQDGKTIHLKG